MMLPASGENGVGPAHYFPRGPGPAGACRVEPDLLNYRHEHDWPVPGTEEDPRRQRRGSEAGRGGRRTERSSAEDRSRHRGAERLQPDHSGPATPYPGNPRGDAVPVTMDEYRGTITKLEARLNITIVSVGVLLALEIIDIFF